MLSVLLANCAATPSKNNNGERTKLFETIKSKDSAKVRAIVETDSVNLDPPTQPNEVNKALAYASIYGNLETVKYILDQGVEIDGQVAYSGTALLRASEVKNFDIAEFLIKSGADVNHPYSFGISAMSGYAITCNTELIDLAIEYGGDIDAAHKMTVSSNFGELAYNPIQWAILENNFECVKHLIARGADLNVLTRDNETLMELATRSKNNEIVKLLQESS